MPKSLEEECDQNLSDSDTLEKVSEDEADNEEEKEDTPLIYLDDDTFKLNDDIEERMRLLQKTMAALRQELADEKEFWRKEVDEIAQLSIDLTSEFDRLTIDGLDGSSDLCAIGNEFSDFQIQNLTIMEYEQQLATYQAALTAVQEEKRNEIRRKTIASAYKQRLMEVDQLCTLELLRVQQNVQFLQPLQTICLGWNNNCQNFIENNDFYKENGSGDKNKNREIKSEDNIKYSPNEFSYKFESLDNILTSEINEIMPPGCNMVDVSNNIQQKCSLLLNDQQFHSQNE